MTETQAHSMVHGCGLVDGPDISAGEQVAVLLNENAKKVTGRVKRAIGEMIPRELFRRKTPHVTILRVREKITSAEIALGFRPDLFATIERIRRRSKAYVEDSRLRSGRK